MKVFHRRHHCPPLVPTGTFNWVWKSGTQTNSFMFYPTRDKQRGKTFLPSTADDVHVALGVDIIEPAARWLLMSTRRKTQVAIQSAPHVAADDRSPAGGRRRSSVISPPLMFGTQTQCESGEAAAPMITTSNPPIGTQTSSGGRWVTEWKETALLLEIPNRLKVPLGVPPVNTDDVSHSVTTRGITQNSYYLYFTELSQPTNHITSWFS